MSTPIGSEIVIGIVVPVFNCVDYLQETLEGIAAQTHAAFECVIVDDGSTDESLSVARDFEARDTRFRVLAQQNSGVGAARNLGLRFLSNRSKYLCFMDSDDVWSPTALETLVAAAESGPYIGAHGLGEFITANGHPLAPGEFSNLGRRRTVAGRWRPRPLATTEPTTFASAVLVSTIFPPGLMIALADLYRQIGGFDNRIRPADDWDAVCRLTRFGDLAFVNDVIIHYRRHDSNAGAGSRIPELCRQVRVKTYFAPENSPEQRVIVRRCFRAAQILDFQETWSHLAAAIRRCDFHDAGRSALRLPLRVARFIRGAPRRRGVDRRLSAHMMQMTTT